MEPLKDQFFNDVFYLKLSQVLHNVVPSISTQEAFETFSTDIEQYELLDRMYKTSERLHSLLDRPYDKALPIVKEIASAFDGGFVGMTFCDFVARYGLDQTTISLDALHFMTRFSSAEFAIRYFLRTDFKNTLETMTIWAEDENVHVRRLACEGSRPRLPWSFKLDRIIESPRLTFPILEKLKADQELYVKKSVGNHINDITKDRTEDVLKLVSAWDLSNTDTNWIVKRGMRSLIKSGNEEALSLFGVSAKVDIDVISFECSKRLLHLNESFDLVCRIVSKSRAKQKLVIDYTIVYQKKGGKLSSKVFKWKEFELLAGEKLDLSKKIEIKNLSTRIHYSGIHEVKLLINGKNTASSSFELII